MNTFDVIIIGGGHAGTEAAAASARIGAKTLLLTHNIETIGQMSCNPAIGGIGKGHLVKEIDALGGLMAQAIDLAGIQFRTLNASKGPAVRATRAQADRVLYKNAIRRFLETQENLFIFQQAVDDLLIENNSIQGVVTQMGLAFYARCVVLTTGTFLGGKIHIGFSNYQGGRAGDPPANTLARRLRDLAFRVERLKTGTPPRLDGRTIDFTKMELQPGDLPTPFFSFMGEKNSHPRQIPCYITHTNEKTHHLIHNSLSRSPLYSGKIEGIGPRYCPSIEDKVVRFAERNAHQIFIEPEGLDVQEFYPNGISTSLPFDVQQELVHSINGLENAHITRPGYAIEYDFFDPRDLYPSLETKVVKGLFFAGQINGTTGYEEAAAQGLIAGLNAARQAQDKEGWYPLRNEAYMGVLIDDLITMGTREPYRMFTSRAEYRLMLREDNADLRLTEKGRQLGIVDETRWTLFSNKREQIEKEQHRLQHIWVSPQSTLGQKIQQQLQIPLSKELTVIDLLRRPDIHYDTLMQVKELETGITDRAVAEQIEIQIKYAGYLQRQQADIERQQQHEETPIPLNFDYQSIAGLSNEVREKLMKVKPTTMGMASRISGVTPAAISLLYIHLKKRSRKKDATG